MPQVGSWQRGTHKDLAQADESSPLGCRSRKPRRQRYGAMVRGFRASQPALRSGHACRPGCYLFPNHIGKHWRLFFAMLGSWLYSPGLMGLRMPPRSSLTTRKRRRRYPFAPHPDASCGCGRIFRVHPNEVCQPLRAGLRLGQSVLRASRASRFPHIPITAKMKQKPGRLSEGAAAAASMPSTQR